MSSSSWKEYLGARRGHAVHSANSGDEKKKKGTNRDGAHKQASYTGSKSHAVVTHTASIFTDDGGLWLMQAHISVQPRENIPHSCICLWFGTFDSTTLMLSAYVNVCPRQSMHGRLTPTVILVPWHWLDRTHKQREVTVKEENSEITNLKALKFPHYPHHLNPKMSPITDFSDHCGANGG